MTLAKLMGLMISILDTIQWARFHSRELQQYLRPFQFHIMLKRDMTLQVPCKDKSSLVWSTRISNLTKSKSLWIQNRLQVFTDASLLGWGVMCKGQVLQSQWLEESQLHITLLELKVIRLALSHFVHLLAGKHVLVRMDNTSAKAHVNKWGGDPNPQC